MEEGVSEYGEVLKRFVANAEVLKTSRRQLDDGSPTAVTAA